MVSLRPALSRLATGPALGVALLSVLALIALTIRLTDSNTAGSAEAPAQEALPPTVGSTGEGVTAAAVVEVGSAAWALELLDALVVSDGTAPVSEPYERDDYDSWIDADGDCQSARHEVLIDESIDSIEFLDDRQCKVGTGRWIDPYSGDIVTAADQASIDHVVSLSEAHHSGAWTWPNTWKQAFFNDIDDPATLAVSLVTVNQDKGSSGPGDWVPESPEARCTYAIARVRVKTRWQLSVGLSDQEALERELNVCLQLELPSTLTTTPLEIIDFNRDPPPTAPRPTPRVTPGTCDPRYPGVCIPMSDDDLDCSDIGASDFAIMGEDPHYLDGNDDGVACEGP